MRLRPGRLILGGACCIALASARVAQADSPAATFSTAPSASAPSAASSAPALPVGSSAPAPSEVVLTALPAPTVGRPVLVTVAHPPADARDFAWDITGRGVHPRHSGASGHAEVVFASAGVHLVAVRFSAGGQTRFGVLTITVAPAPAPAPARAPAAAPAPAPARAPAAPAAPARERASVRRAAPVALDTQVTPHAAGDPPVAVADFHFSPPATTIHVGATVTWTNNGPSSHTATARNGGFDTGVLKKGQSASHTFTQTGTFTYFCQIHPFMHGTIVVQAATPSTTPAAATTPAATTAAATPAVTTAAAPPTSTAAAVPTGPTLPNTGFNVLGGLFAGLLLVGVGAALRQTRSR